MHNYDRLFYFVLASFGGFEFYLFFYGGSWIYKSSRVRVYEDEETMSSYRVDLKDIKG